MAKDPTPEAARIVRNATQPDETLPPDLEAAWAKWIKEIQKVDERARTLLREAFEAGVEAGSQPSNAAELGRRGGLKGGKARAEKLTAEQRREIAKKAARARWSTGEGGRA